MGSLALRLGAGLEFGIGGMEWHHFDFFGGGAFTSVLAPTNL
jgi:hypothetical protein